MRGGSRLHALASSLPATLLLTGLCCGCCGVNRKPAPEKPESEITSEIQAIIRQVRGCCCSPPAHAAMLMESMLLGARILLLVRSLPWHHMPAAPLKACCCMRADHGQRDVPAAAERPLHLRPAGLHRHLLGRAPGVVRAPPMPWRRPDARLTRAVAHVTRMLPGLQGGVRRALHHQCSGCEAALLHHQGEPSDTAESTCSMAQEGHAHKGCTLSQVHKVAALVSYKADAED